MDGFQRNFNMMAEKIDRMRCLRERCDNYVKLIKLILDETIQEQNSLLNGSDIHNRLKYLGFIDKPKSSSDTLCFDKIYPKKIDFDNKYKHFVYGDHTGTRKHINRTNLYMNDMFSSNTNNDYHPKNKPQIHDYSSTEYDSYNSEYNNMPISSKKYGKIMNFHIPNLREYQVYYFPTSKPIAQYPRHTTERFYKRKPVQQYPQEEVPYWPTQYPKPVRIIERESSYSLPDYSYQNATHYPFGNPSFEYSPEYRTRYYPINDNMTYPGYDDYYETDLRQRSFSTITRPCSPVYSRDVLYDKTNPANFGTLLEKKIRDYVWNPHKERVERYSTPSYERSTYYTGFKSIQNKCQGDEVFKICSSTGLESQVQNSKVELIIDNFYKRNSLVKSPEEILFNNDNFDSQKDNGFFENNSYKQKTETPTHFSKRISFDLDDEKIELPVHKSSIGENIYDKPNVNERKLTLGRKESSTIHEDQCQTSLLSNGNYSALVSNQRGFPSDKNVNSGRESLRKLDKQALIQNSFESDEYLNLKNDIQENEPKLFEKKELNNYKDIEKVDYNYNNIRRNSRRRSNDNSQEKMMETSEQSRVCYQDGDKSTLNKMNNININERRESFKGEPKLTKKVISGNKIYSNNVDNQLEQELKKQPNSINDSSKTSSTVDYNNVSNYKNNEQEIDHFQQFINYEHYLENYTKTNLPYHEDNSSNNDLIDIKQFNERDSYELKTIPIEQQPQQEIVNEEFMIERDYYQDHPNDDEQEHTTKEYETQPENITKHVINDENYYPNETTESNKELTMNNNIEPKQPDEIVEENIIHGDNYYYQNPKDNINENENQYEKPDTPTNDVNEQHANDDYYYQNNYSNIYPKEKTLENQYTVPGHQGDYVVEPTEHDDYYYQNHARDDIKKQQVDNQYVDPDYQGNYTEQQPAHDDYYYQNYSNADLNGQPDNKYTDPSQQAEYVPENINHDYYYYYQNQSEENPNGNRADQHYTESETQGNYENGEQGNYYYEDNTNANTEMLPPGQYDEYTQRENYADDQHVNDDYYYQKQDENYDENIPKEQYDGYVGEQHQTNESYYPNSSANNYDTQQGYENNSHQAQLSEYAEPYEQNPSNENYNYSDNIDEIQPANQISNEQTKQ